MLNTTLRDPPSYKSKDGKARLRFPLEPFTMFHPETEREIQVVPHLHVRDRTVFHDFNGIGRSKGRGPAEIFVLAHPYVSRLRTRPDTVFLHFEVNQGAHYAWQGLADLARAVTKRPEFREPQAV